MRSLLFVCSIGLLICLGLASLQPVESAPADASFTVTVTSDAVDGNIGDGVCLTAGGQCSLRAAIQEANARYATFGGRYTITLPTIGFVGTKYSLSVPNGGGDEDNAASGDLDVKCNLTLRGTGAFPPAIDASALNDRVFELINPPGAAISVTMTNLVVYKGSVTGDGGGILSAIRGTLTLNSVQLTNNTVSAMGAGAGSGGGLASLAGTLLMNNSIVRGNTVLDGVGAGLELVGPAVIKNSTIRENSARIVSPGYAGYGGGIFHSSSTLVISNSLILSNTMLVSNTTARSGGGGLFELGLLTITNSSVQSNVASSVSGSQAHSRGGGLLASGPTMRLIGTNVSFNRTLIGGQTNGDGGGLHVGLGTLLLDHSQVYSNSSGTGGGVSVDTADATIRDSSLGSNFAIVSGGGISSNGALRIRSSTLHDNVAASFAAGGGGIYSSGILSLTNSTLFRNVSDAHGGGLLVDGGTAHVDSSTIVQNIADRDAEILPGGPGDGGGIYVATGATLYLRNSLLMDNYDFTPSASIPNCAGTLISQDYNLVRILTGCNLVGATVHNIIGQPASIGLFGDYGGPAWTLPLLGGIAVNGGDPAGCKDELGAPLTTDQRGRPRLGPCDIGAFEFMLETFLPVIRR